MQIVDQNNPKEQKIEETYEEPQQDVFQEVDFNKIGEQQAPVQQAPAPVFVPPVDTMTPMIAPTAKKKKGYWIIKIPILVYLIFSSVLIYIAGISIGVSMNTVWALLGLHGVATAMYILLLALTRK